MIQFISDQYGTGAEMRFDFHDEGWRIYGCWNRHAYACFVWGC